MHLFRNTTRLLLCFVLCAQLVLPLAAEEVPATELQSEIDRAIAAYDKKDFQQAKEILNKLLIKSPDNPKILNNLAAIAVYEKDYDTAIELLRRAITSNSDISIVYNNLSLIYSHQAVLAYQKALMLETKNTTALEINLIGKQQKQFASSGLLAKKLLLEEDLDKSLVSGYEPVPTAPDATKKEIITAVKQWAKAWSQQDLAAYFDSYLKNYLPASTQSHDDWKKIRKTRLTRPKFIKVQVSNIRADITDGIVAKITFVQHYHSNTMKTTVRKQLEMLKLNERWKIIDEKTMR